MPTNAKARVKGELEKVQSLLTKSNNVKTHPIILVDTVVVSRPMVPRCLKVAKALLTTTPAAGLHDPLLGTASTRCPLAA